MADFSLTTLFVVPVDETIVSSGSTQDLTAGQVGFFGPDYVAATSGDIDDDPYFYVAQGRENTYLQGSKRSDKIKGCPSGTGCRTNVIEWYKVTGCPNPLPQITEIGNWDVKCGEIITLTIRAHSSYLDTLYFNGFTRSVTVVAPCCECDGDPCDTVDVDDLIDLIMEKLTGYAVTGGVIYWDTPLSAYQPTGINPDNISLNTFFTFSKVGSGSTAKIRITGKTLTKYAQPCDVAAFPWEYDRMWFRTFVYTGPATTADFIVSDACNIVAVSTITQNSNYAKGTAAEIKQMEKNYHSYQAGYLKHLYTKMGYNYNFESWVDDTKTYDTFYIKFTDLEPQTWGDYVKEDNMVIIAAVTGSTESTAIETILGAALGTVTDASGDCITTTSTTTTQGGL